jgi:hypothetical protein
MKSFKLEKPKGDADVTHETLMWGLILFLVIVPIIVIVAAPFLTNFLELSSS